MNYEHNETKDGQHQIKLDLTKDEYENILKYFKDHMEDTSDQDNPDVRGKYQCCRSKSGEKNKMDADNFFEGALICIGNGWAPCSMSRRPC